jgi:hypothetical protein
MSRNYKDKFYSEQPGAIADTIHITEKEKKMTLEQLQKMVGGYIQLIKLYTVDDKKVKAQMIVNEEGFMMGLVVNKTATRILKEEGNYGQTAQPIVGTVMILHGDARIS